MNRSITTTSLRSHTAVASGYLHKLTHNGTPFARWHQRYYVLYTDGLLRSFKSSRARNSHRVIPVGRKCLRVRFGVETRSDECSRWPKNCPRSLRFSVINSDREYHFYCESEREFAVWRDSFRQILTKLGSAHSSYVERRGSKLRPLDWADGGKEDEDSSAAPTPAGSLRYSKPRAAEKRRERGERAQKRTREKETGVGEGYDSVGPEIPYTDLDEGEESEKDQNCQLSSTALSRGKENGRKFGGRVHQTQEAREEDLPEGVSDSEVNGEVRWSLSNYARGERNASRQNTNTIDAAFFEVQAIIDETFNDMC